MLQCPKRASRGKPVRMKHSNIPTIFNPAKAIVQENKLLLSFTNTPSPSSHLFSKLLSMLLMSILISSSKKIHTKQNACRCSSCLYTPGDIVIQYSTWTFLHCKLNQITRGISTTRMTVRFKQLVKIQNELHSKCMWSQDLRNLLDSKLTHYWCSTSSTWTLFCLCKNPQ